MTDTLTRLREKRRDDDGFTLIELLVVVVIIGVLVAIAVPVYLNYRQGAADKSAQSDVRGAISAIEQFYTDNSAYPAGPTTTQTASFLLTGSTTARVTLSRNTQLIYVPVGASYKLCATNTGGNKYYRYSSATGGSVEEATPAITSLANC
jgi:type IV pilus assembly protein PilA